MAQRNYKKEYKEYHGKPKQIKRRSSRNHARKIMKKLMGAKINGKDIHHKDGNPLNNKKNNLKIMSKKINRGKK